MINFSHLSLLKGCENIFPIFSAYFFAAILSVEYRSFLISIGQKVISFEVNTIMFKIMYGYNL